MALVQGNDSNNSLTGTLGNDTINALDGNDAISDGLGRDIVNAGSGNDTITNVGGRDTIDAGPGDDWVVTDLSPTVIDPLNIAPWSFELGLDLATGFTGVLMAA